ncbi:hypothetical protein [Nocardioides sp. AE5]|uniref:hypothetical protein n=1 Tax=Nocardioides sp. AE5 TaxID=2962573 RepID=UPI0028825B9E|nr:hypothetical protein [Nocardioides sp. AE5]MDT0202528.1 hypothetical protein [Nocardioides sp. AE5]
MMRRTLATLAVTALPLGLLAGCGDDSADDPFEGKSPEEVQALVIEAMQDVESVRMSARMTSDGEALSLVVVLDRDANCDGSIAVDGAKADIKSDGEWAYLRGDEAFWAVSTGSEAAATQLMAMIGDKWVRGPAADFNDFCDLDGFLEEFNEDPNEEGGFEIGDVEKVEGVDVVKLTKDEPDEETGDITTMWVAAEAPHRVVKLVAEGGDEPGEATFSKYNEDVDLDLPADDEWIDLNTLG